MISAIQFVKIFLFLILCAIYFIYLFICLSNLLTTHLSHRGALCNAQLTEQIKETWFIQGSSHSELNGILPLLQYFSFNSFPEI